MKASSARWFSVFLLVFCQSFLWGQAKAPHVRTRSSSLPDLIERVRPCIARVEVSYTFHTLENPSATMTVDGNGTGFIFDADGHIATAGHVVSTEFALRDLSDKLLREKNLHVDPTSFFRNTMGVTFPLPSVESDATGTTYYGTGIGETATILTEDDLSDVAILKCRNNPLRLPPSKVSGLTVPPPSVAALQTRKPRDGDMISVSGFPLSIPVLVTNTGWIASSFFRDEKDRSLYLGSILINHGNSGGPVYSDSDGRILGIVVEYRPAPEGNSGLTVIVPIQRVLDLLAASPNK